MPPANDPAQAGADTMKPPAAPPAKILVVDIGGTKIKVLASGQDGVPTIHADGEANTPFQLASWRVL